MNCFALAAIEDIPAEINKIRTDHAEISNLQEKLGDKVTAHIKRVWPSHPVKIKFQINNSALSFLVEDDKVKYKSKTTAQRSDGFRQFISFLLTVSAESATNQLSNSLLLLDEPETHLHPQAQEYLKDELIKITKNSENNIVFFATHSNYMIDKEHIDRCFRVVKEKNKRTTLERIEGISTSYSEVNYEVFDIPSSDYHNELYGYLEDIKKTELDGLSKTKDWINEKTSKTDKVSLATFIRHSIHHPENTSNPKFTPEELRQSIEILRGLKYKKGTNSKGASPIS
jgi:energy-coupling factor transporter ATP-binding protein EcfA2